MNFISCESILVETLYGTYTNKPVNLGLCHYFEKSTSNSVYDVNQTHLLPSIYFSPVNIEWVFITEKDRDLMYDIIIKQHTNDID